MTSQKYSIQPTFSHGLIYIYSIPDEAHEGRLKIGSATVSDTSQASLEAAAHDRIKQQTKTADIRYKLEYVTLARTTNNDYFSDYTVHDVLKRSGYERQSTNVKNTHSEWFKVDLNTAINAIQAAKEGRAALNSKEKLSDVIQYFDFRPNQLDAIEKTSKAIKRGRKHFLWNAKMRFGKTSTAMEVAKVNKLQRVLIVTHRPSVSQDWYEDFNKVFQGTNYQYSSKDKGETIKYRLSHDEPFVYFASLQDLRLSEAVIADESSKSIAKGFKKNDEIFDTTWDMLIVDEAHEGTQSNLGNVTIEKIDAKFTLELSGTPFNIIHKREEDEVYTWDYVMEQYDKVHWDETHPGAPNPYAELPALSMFTYDIDKFSSHIGDLGTFTDIVDGAFKFHEFFRVVRDEDGKDTAEFVYKEMVNKFLDLLVDDTLATKFPYATEEYRSYNKHTLWHLPNRTRVIEAMEKLLKAHPVFSKFGIVNISGNAVADDEADVGAKDRVMNAIKNNEYTITLTGQRLTTGASIPQWTAVCMMSDTSSATTYLQTAFRCQTPAKIGGKLKTQGYVFDFAPDRTLRLVAEAIELNHKSGKVNTPEQRQAMHDFLNFCPIISAQSGSMREYDVSGMLEQLKKAIVERVSRNGFDDPKLYNDELLQLGEVEISKFNDLRALVGTSSTERTNEIKVNDLGMNKLTTKQAEDAERKKKKKKQLTPEEEEILKKLKEAREQKKSAISILRAVSIRMPMLVYGARVAPDQGISLEEFINIVDDESWVEFMPKRLTKETFREFIKYYDEEVFQGVTKSIRLRVYECDKLLPIDRIQAITEVFSTFKNPDKETVLTPWNVVNMHISSTLGGYDFRNGIINKTGQPEWKSVGEQTRLWSDDDVRILEINSKSGLYPLLAAYNIYTRQLKKQKQPEDKVYKRLWSKVLADNVYVLCKSPMAKTITIRTLAGYAHVKTNVAYIDGLVDKLQNEREYNLSNDLSKQFGAKMKFTAVVGNPPYQLQKGGTKNIDIWQNFVLQGTAISELGSFIHPGRWVMPKKQMQKVQDDLLNAGLYHFDYYPNANQIFPSVAIDGGITITTFKAGYTGDVKYRLNGVTKGVFDKEAKFISDEFEAEAFEKLNPEKFNNRSMNDRIIGNLGSLGGSEFGYSKTSQIDKLHQSASGMTDPVKIWANKGYGKGTRFEWHYIERSELKSVNQVLFDTRKVMLDKKGHAATSGRGNIINNMPVIVDHKATASGDVFFVIPEHDDDYELELIKSLFITRTARFLMSISQKDLYVRGLENIPDYMELKDRLNGKYFTDQWFYEEFNFSKELIAHIEKIISEKK